MTQPPDLCRPCTASQPARAQPQNPEQRLGLLNYCSRAGEAFEKKFELNIVECSFPEPAIPSLAY